MQRLLPAAWHRRHRRGTSSAFTAQCWTSADRIPEGQPLFVKMGGWLKKPWYRLAHQPDGACVFLDERGLCRIHGKFGEPAKPLACRIYPYAFHPAGGQVTVSLRFSCPSVVKNLGRPVTQQRGEIRDLARQIVPKNITSAAPPEVKPGTRLSWKDVLRITSALDETFAADDAQFLQRLLQSLFWMGLVEQSKFDVIQGERLGEFLDIIREAAAAEVSETDTAPSEPTSLGQMQFRLLAGQYARKDTYAADRSMSARMHLLRTAWRLTRGTGKLPPIQACFREVPFSEIEQFHSPLPDDADELFARYFRVKIQGMHFCGRAYYGVPMVEGFDSLALVYPVVLWIARWLALSAGHDQLTTDDIVQALTIADHNHGYTPAGGTWTFRSRVRTLSRLGDIPKLCVKYSG